MEIMDVLTRYKFPREVHDVFRRSGIATLYPPQAQAIEKGVLEGKNLLLSVPTASGKTLIAELCMLKALWDNQGGRCLYVVPLKALASEKYEEFKEKFTPLGIKVGIATGDADTSPLYLSQYKILIATAEKVDSLLRSRTSWLMSSLHVAVLDEIHFINDGSRGPTLEILAARIKQLNPQAQMLALSATIGNAAELAGWLKAELVESNWRPIPLREGIYFAEKITFKNHPIRIVKPSLPTLNRLINEAAAAPASFVERSALEDSDDLNKLTLDTLLGKGQVLIFVNSRRSAQAASRQLCKSVVSILTPEQKNQLVTLAREALGSSSQATKICRNLADVLHCGVAFHHAGLKPQQRKLIEDHFKKGLIKVICSTPTLAAGVNLPARRTIIRDHKRFESGLGNSFIPVSEYKQCAGRAGRPRYDEYGEAVLMAKSSSDGKALWERYIDAAPEPVMSQLGDPSVLRIHILASIAGEYVHDVRGMFEFLAHTFLAHQKRTSNLIEIISEIFEFLQGEGFIEKSGFRFFATTFGQCTSRLYIDPASSIILRNGLKKAVQGKSFSVIGLLHLIACCPDSPLLQTGKNDFDDLQAFSTTCEDELIMTAHDLPRLEDFVLNLSILKTAKMLWLWIEEEREEKICDLFNVGPGDIYRHTENVKWLLHATLVFAELFECKKLTFPIASLKDRIQYGIKEELVALTQLKGIGRVRARFLFEKGFRHPRDLKYASIEELAEIHQIGKTLAEDLLQQVVHFTS